MLPVALDAEPLEFLALDVDPVFREGAAFAAEFHHRHRVLVLALGAVFLLDLPLDRQTVTVPARHVIGIEAEHLLAARHHVLQDLVDRVPDMDVAVGIRRAVMQDEFHAALRRLAHLLVETLLLPARQQLRLALRQPGAHRKIRLRQEQCLGIVALRLGHGGVCSRGAKNRKDLRLSRPVPGGPASASKPAGMPRRLRPPASATGSS